MIKIFKTNLMLEKFNYVNNKASNKIYNKKYSGNTSFADPIERFEIIKKTSSYYYTLLR